MLGRLLLKHMLKSLSMVFDWLKLRTSDLQGELRASCVVKFQLWLPSESIGEHLLLSLVYDWPEAVQSLGDENLTEWGVSF
jgi:hypothetical protein